MSPSSILVAGLAGHDECCEEQQNGLDRKTRRPKSNPSAVCCPFLLLLLLLLLLPRTIKFGNVLIKRKSNYYFPPAFVYPVCQGAGFGFNRLVCSAVHRPPFALARMLDGVICLLIHSQRCVCVCMIFYRRVSACVLLLLHLLPKKTHIHSFLNGIGREMSRRRT